MTQTTLNGVFIEIEVDPTVRGDAALAAKLAEVCPVDIFAAGPEGVTIVEANLDECVLCRLCIEAAADRGPVVTVRKKYSGDVLR